MSLFLQSAGKQFARSPGRQRDSVGFSVTDEDANRYTFNKPTREALFALMFSGDDPRPDFDVFPARALIPPRVDPDIGIFVPGGFEGPNNGVDAHDVYAETWDYLTSAPAVRHMYHASWPEAPILTPGATTPIFPFETQLFGYEPWINRLDWWPPSDVPLDAKTAQQQHSFGHLSHYRRLRQLNYEPPSPGGQVARREQFIGSRARFRTAHQVGQAWRATGRVEEVIALAETGDGLGTKAEYVAGWTFHDLTVVETFQVVPMVWYEVLGPFDVTGLGENTFSFIVHSETPAQWQARTGIPLAGA